ncbi:uncharacterized protein LOC127507744 [Ctenopharyngodon idella]|uniref:uncharacterized protein LOC127507744 n=1 Tax=Ctenopharyngodon idella TaxID=7959 RepID=UPI002231410D|nr:uncharacterized protein LOC127507744 [Ctenopharyngodon idella]
MSSTDNTVSSDITDPNLDAALDTSPEMDSFPAVEGQNTKDDINQTQHKSNQEDNEQLGEEGNTAGQADMSETHELCDSDSSVNSIDNIFPNLTIVLTGNTSAIHCGQDNILLKENLNIENVEISRIVPLKIKISNHYVSLINMTGLHEDELYPNCVDHIGQLVNENEISAFIFVVRLDQLTDADKMGLEWLQKVFGDRVLRFVMILFTYETKEERDTIKDDLKETPALEILEKCGGRYHTCSKLMNKLSEIKKLMKKIDCLFNENQQQCYTGDIYKTALRQTEDLNDGTFQSEETTDDKGTMEDTTTSETGEKHMVSV